MRLVSKQETSMTDDKGYYDLVNGHTLVELKNQCTAYVYVCTNCGIRGPYPKAFEDISSCK